MIMNPAKTAELIEVLFGLWTRVGPRNPVRWGSRLSMCRGNFEGGLSPMSCAKNDWTDRDAIWDVDSGGPKETRITWSPDPYTWRGIFEGVVGPGHVRRSIYSKRCSRGQHWYGAHADWCVLDGVHIGDTSWMRLNHPSVMASMCSGDVALCQTLVIIMTQFLHIDQYAVIYLKSSHIVSMCQCVVP